MPRSATLIFALLLIAGSIFVIESRKPERGTPGGNPVVLSQTSPGREKAGVSRKPFPVAQEIADPQGFINTPNNQPVTIADFVGKKVILVDFWTYSCINCQRTLPYLTAWNKKYRDQGLQIIGIHTPEFDFEKKQENVRTATKKYGVEYPVVLDNNYATWNAYGNRYWPRKYLIDIDGYIVYDHIGEGGYEETEKKIQELLAERAERLGGNFEKTSPLAIAPVENSSESPEIYFGASRNETLGNGSRGQIGIQTLTPPRTERLNTLYLTGKWNIQNEFAENTAGGEKIIFRYKAKSVYLVAGSDTGSSMKLFVDGKPVGETRGEDVNPSTGAVRVTEERLYTLIEGTRAEEHTLEIQIDTPGLRAFTFTFG